MTELYLLHALNPAIKRRHSLGRPLKDARVNEHLEEHRTDLIAQNPIHILRRHRRVRRTHLAVPVRMLCDIRPVRNIRRPCEQRRTHRIHPSTSMRPMFSFLM